MKNCGRIFKSQLVYHSIWQHNLFKNENQRKLKILLVFAAIKISMLIGGQNPLLTT